MRAELVDFLASGLTDSSGNPLSGGKIYTYSGGTTTDKATWTDNLKASQAANPIVLDSVGRKQIYADGNYKFVVKDSADNTLYTWDNVAYGLDDGSSVYGGTSTGAANTYVITCAPALSELATGTLVRFKAHQDNSSTTPTLNVNSTGAKTITLSDGDAVIAKDIQNGSVYLCEYDGANFRLLNPSVEVGTWTPTLTPQAGTLSGETYGVQRYYRSGTKVDLQLSLTATLASSAASYIQFSLPFTAVSGIFSFTGLMSDGGSYNIGFAYTATTTAARAYMYDANTFAIGTVSVQVQGWFEMAV